MSSKMFMYFFLQSKRNKGFWWKHFTNYLHIVYFNGLQTVEGQNDSFSAASKAINDIRWWIRLLSSETIGHLKKLNECENDCIRGGASWIFMQH